MSQRVDLRSSNKHVALQNVSIYYKWKNIRKQYKNTKFKITALNWTDRFESPDVSYSISYIQDYIEYIIKKHEALTSISPIHVQINRINKRLVFIRKDGYKLELQTPGFIKLFGSTKKLIERAKNGKVTIPEVAEAALFQFNLADNQYQQNSEVLYTFTPSKFYAYLLNIGPSNLVFLKTYNTETFTKLS